MIKEQTPTYIIELKDDLVKHIDTSLSDFMATIYKTVALKEDVVSIREDIVSIREDVKSMATKEDIKNMAMKDDIALIWDNMATKEDIKTLATKHDFDRLYNLVGRYETRAQNIEEILLEDHKPRIVDLEREVFAA